MTQSKAASSTAKSKAVGQKSLHPTLGFGVPATSDPHHFKVIIPRSNTGRVQISEYLGMQATADEHAVIDRVLLDRPRWTAATASSSSQGRHCIPSTCPPARPAVRYRRGE